MQRKPYIIYAGARAFSIARDLEWVNELFGITKQFELIIVMTSNFLIVEKFKKPYKGTKKSANNKQQKEKKWKFLRFLIQTLTFW